MSKKDTKILFTSIGDRAVICTSSRKLRRRVKRAMRKYPDEIQFIAKTERGIYEYEVPKDMVALDKDAHVDFSYQEIEEL